MSGPEDPGSRATTGGAAPKAEAGPVDPAHPPTDHAAVVRCDLCGAAMLDLHCKLVCRRCGYKRDCSDP